MSTAGKVLSVLVILVAVAWMFLTATVSQLNHNGAEAVEQLKKQVEKLDKDVATATHDLQKAKDDWTLDQVATQDRLTVLQARQTDLEKARSVVQEIKTRVDLQLADAETIAKTSATNLEQRIAEKKNETEALVKTRTEVEQLKTERTELVGRLTELREKFKATLEENRSLTERVQKKGAVPASRSVSPPARPVSFTR
jgi:chromosome segregation ATPase